MQLPQRLIPPLVLMLLSLQFTNAVYDEDEPRFGVRALLNEGTVPANHGCDANEFEIVKTAVQSHLSTPIRRSMQTINCKFSKGAAACGSRYPTTPPGAKVCCGFAYGTCVVYHPRCYGYPTPASNHDECARRLWETINISNDDSEECNNMKRAALTAIIESIDDGVSMECTNFMLAPTRLECYLVDGGYAQPEPRVNTDCTVAPSQYLQPSVWYGAITVGFDAPSAVLDFTGTTIDPTSIGDVWGDENVFTSITVEGVKLILIAKETNRWFSSVNKSQIHFSSHTGTDKLESLYSTGLPKCHCI